MQIYSPHAGLSPLADGIFSITSVSNTKTANRLIDFPTGLKIKNQTRKKRKAQFRMRVIKMDCNWWSLGILVQCFPIFAFFPPPYFCQGAFCSVPCIFIFWLKSFQKRCGSWWIHNSQLEINQIKGGKKLVCRDQYAVELIVAEQMI